MYWETIQRHLLLILCLLLLHGCGVGNIVGRGEYIDQASIPPGTPRKELVTRFGAPILVETNKAGQKEDTFRVPQGETTAGKVLKGGGILVLDVLTLGLTEAVATPVTQQKDYVTFVVTYDPQDKVTSCRFLSGP